jgi:hypothetical protein
MDWMNGTSLASATLNSADAVCQTDIGAARQAGLGGSLIGQAVKITETKRPELAEYMERSAVCLAYTEELVQTLEKRLCMVLAPATPSTNDKAMASPAPVTYYGQQMHALIERLGNVNSTVRGMLDRLEA